MRSAALLFLLCALLPAIDTRNSVGDYPARLELPNANIGVEYLVHSYNAGGQMYFTKDYIVFEVGIFPKGPLTLSSASFQLRINQAKKTISQAAAESVATSLRHPDWNQSPTGDVGIGDDTVRLGGRQSPRFPGDPTTPSTRPLPRAPEDPNKPAKEVVDEPRLVIDNALLTGQISTPTAGYIYFPYSGNLKKLKNLSLVFRDGDAEKEIPIR